MSKRDCMSGSGTTLIEAKLLGRDAIGLDIDSEAVELAKKASRGIKCKTLHKGRINELLFPNYEVDLNV